MDEMTLTLNNPLTEEDWDLIEDVDFDKTNSIEFHTKHGKTVKFVKCTDERVWDLISRQAAIDIERRATVDTNPYHFEAHQKFMEFMDNPEISSYGRWQWSNGFNTALTAISIDLKKLPSAQPQDIAQDIARIIENERDMRVIAKNAQPDIIRCKDCKYRDPEDKKCDSGHFIRWQLPRDDDWFCADAERRET